MAHATRSSLDSASPSEDTLCLADRVFDILRPLSPIERDQVLQVVTERVRPIRSPRAGEVLGAVILAFPLKPRWTVEELKQNVQEQGVVADPKEIYNALSYLVRKGDIRRLSYGKYVLAGAGIEIDENDDGAVRDSEHFT